MAGPSSEGERHLLPENLDKQARQAEAAANAHHSFIDNLFRDPKTALMVAGWALALGAGA